MEQRSKSFLHHFKKLKKATTEEVHITFVYCMLTVFCRRLNIKCGCTKRNLMWNLTLLQMSLPLCCLSLHPHLSWQSKVQILLGLDTQRMNCCSCSTLYVCKYVFVVIKSDFASSRLKSNRCAEVFKTTTSIVFYKFSYPRHTQLINIPVLSQTLNVVKCRVHANHSPLPSRSREVDPEWHRWWT